MLESAADTPLSLVRSVMGSSWESRYGAPFQSIAPIERAVDRDNIAQMAGWRKRSFPPTPRTVLALACRLQPQPLKPVAADQHDAGGTLVLPGTFIFEGVNLPAPGTPGVHQHDVRFRIPASRSPPSTPSVAMPPPRSTGSIGPTRRGAVTSAGSPPIPCSPRYATSRGSST